MITCPTCQNREKEGTLFCNQCGSPLYELHPVSPATVGVLLSLLDNGQILPLQGRGEFTVGRVSEGDANLPDIDLAPYQGYEKGVSRIHATITLEDRKACLMDMDSVNGTLLNGQRIQPKLLYDLHHGDLITLGKMKIQFLYRES